MPAVIPRNGTEWVFDPLTLAPGTTAAQITAVACMHTVDPNAILTVAGHTHPVQLVGDDTHPLWRTGWTGPHTATRIGARVGTGILNLAVGDWQRHLAITTTEEDILVKTGTVSIT